MLCTSQHDCVFDSFGRRVVEIVCRFIHFLFSFVGSVMEDLVVGKKKPNASARKFFKREDLEE